MSKISFIPEERIGSKILLIRGQKVMLDKDLAELYGVELRILNQAVKRNIRRFPEDFMFQLSPEEGRSILRSQIVISSSSHGGRRYMAYAFTEQGVAMLSSVLRSDQAIEVNIMIMRTFVQLRQWLSSHTELAKKIEELEARYDGQFQAVFDAIRQLVNPPQPRKRRKIGFKLEGVRSSLRSRLR